MFHRIWLSEDPDRSQPPAPYQENWNAWQRQFPDRDFRTWTDDDIGEFGNVAASVDQAQGMARKADILRYAVLEKFGGVYLDCDIEPYHRTAEFLDLDEALVCNEDDATSYCSIGFIAAPPNHPLFGGLIAEVASKPLNQTSPNIETGPHLFGRHVNRSNRIRRLPKTAFYPYHFSEARSAILGRDLDAAMGIHQWGGSWMTRQARESLILSNALQSDAFEIEEAVRNGQIDDSSPIVALSRDLRRGRESYGEIALKHSGSLGGFDLSARKCLELLKIAFWLHRENHDPVVWQIGAADGVVADPIRPYIVRCDPRAVLVEPNPWMFARLEVNYSKNKNIKLVPAALVDVEGEFTMNCVVPDEVRARRLPEWVLGISSLYSDKNALDGRDLPPTLHSSILQAVRQEKIRGLTVESICQRTDMKLPDILVVDAEGMDSQILKSVLKCGAKPFLIHFEHCNLSHEEKVDLNRLLQEDYVIFVFGNDATVVRKDVLIAYSSSIWMEHGVEGIFAPLFDRISPFRR